MCNTPISLVHLTYWAFQHPPSKFVREMPVQRGFCLGGKKTVINIISPSFSFSIIPLNTCASEQPQNQQSGERVEEISSFTHCIHLQRAAESRATKHKLSSLATCQIHISPVTAKPACRVLKLWVQRIMMHFFQKAALANKKIWSHVSVSHSLSLDLTPVLVSKMRCKLLGEKLLQFCKINN